MKHQETKLVETKTTEEVYVTNVAIKTTDTLTCVAAGAFALTGIVCLWKAVKNNKQQKENEATRDRIIGQMISEGKSSEEIAEVKKMLDKFF